MTPPRSSTTPCSLRAVSFVRGFYMCVRDCQRGRERVYSLRCHRETPLEEYCSSLVEGCTRWIWRGIRPNKSSGMHVADTSCPPCTPCHNSPTDRWAGLPITWLMQLPFLHHVKMGRRTSISLARPQASSASACVSAPPSLLPSSPPSLPSTSCSTESRAFSRYCGGDPSSSSSSIEPPPSGVVDLDVEIED